MAPVLALCGFMGSGKSAIGRRVAQAQGWWFVDLDKVVESGAGRTIPEIFATDGEAAFRHMEHDALRCLVGSAEAGNGLVLALGGGTVTVPESIAVLRTADTPGGSLLVYLDVDTDLAWSRVAGSTRPLARTKDRFTALAIERRPIYEAVADRTVVADGTPDQVAGRVVALLREWPGAAETIPPEAPPRPGSPTAGSTPCTDSADGSRGGSDR